MKRLTLTPSAAALALVLCSCASEQIAPPTASLAAAPVPTDIGDAVDLAKTQRGARDLDGATATLSQLVLIAPDDPRVLGEYGKILLDRGESLDALAFLQRAIELSPGEWSFYSAQGVAFAQRGDFRSAQMAFGRALMLKPNDPVVLNNFALAHLQAGNLDQAETLLLRASLSGDLHPKVAQNLALVRQMRGSAQPDAPTGGAAATDVPTAPPDETTEPNVIAFVEDAWPPDSQESHEVSVVEALEVQESVVDMAEDPGASLESEATASDPTDSVEETTGEILEQAEAPTIENEVIETVKLAKVETAADLAQKFVAEADEPAVEDELAETAAQEEDERVADELESDIWIPSTGPIYLQVGAFTSQENAGRVIEKLEKLEPQIAVAISGERKLYRVVVGPYADRGETHLALGALGELGIDDVQVLTRLPGEVQQRDEIADEDASGAMPGDVASENSDAPESGISTTYADSL